MPVRLRKSLVTYSPAGYVINRRSWASVIFSASPPQHLGKPGASFLPAPGKEAVIFEHDAEVFFPILDSRMSEG